MATFYWDYYQDLLLTDLIPPGHLAPSLPLCRLLSLQRLGGHLRDLDIFQIFQAYLGPVDLSTWKCRYRDLRDQREHECIKLLPLSQDATQILQSCFCDADWWVVRDCSEHCLGHLWGDCTRYVVFFRAIKVPMASTLVSRYLDITWSGICSAVSSFGTRGLICKANNTV